LFFFVNLPVAAALAVAALKVIPGDGRRPQWRGLDLGGAALATGGLGAVVYAITQAEHAGWTSTRTLATAAAGLAALAAFALYERRTRTPLLRIERLRDRAVGGGLALMTLNAALMFGLFLLSSLYLQIVLGRGALATGLAFIPLALAAGAGAHASGHVVSRHGVRVPVAASLLIAAAGLYLLSQVGEHGTYLHDVLPGMLIAGFGLGLSGVSASIAVLAGTREGETGMLSGVNATGHEIGGTIGIAVFSTIAAGTGGVLAGPAAAAGIADAFLIGAHLTLVAAVAALVVLPRTRHFLARVRLSPQAMPVH
jgi:hypothetical protein